MFVRNKKQLIEAVKVFIKNNNLRKKYSLFGYERSKSFSFKKTAKKILEIYNWVLKTKTTYQQIIILRLLNPQLSNLWVFYNLHSLS